LNIHNLPFNDIDISTAFPTLAFSMHMHRVMLIGVKDNDKPKVFIKFWHLFFRDFSDFRYQLSVLSHRRLRRPAFMPTFLRMTEYPLFSIDCHLIEAFLS
jgi:hypothetical protein